MMTKLYLLAALPLALAACSKSDSTDNATAAAAAPIAAAPAPAGKPWTQVVSKTAEGYVMGNPNAPIKLVEYGSRLCPTCGGFAREGYVPLTQNYVSTGKVSFEFREYLVHGAPDLPPALIGLCMGGDTFFPLLEQMYQNQEAFDERLQKMSPEQQKQLQAAKPQDAIRMMGEQMGLIDFAKQNGIPEAKARQCMGDMTTIDKLTKQTQDHTADGSVTSTPTFFINGTVVPNVLTWPQMDQVLKARGA